VVLPWMTVLLGAAAGLLALVPWALSRTRGHSAYLVYYIPPVLVSTLGACLLALGVTAFDRFRRRPRAARWALGMGVAGLIPVTTIVYTAFPSQPTSGSVWGPYLIAYSLAEVASNVLVGALLGCALGVAAGRRRWLFLYLPAAGCCSQMVLHYALLAVPLVWTPSTSSAHRYFQVMQCAPLVYPTYVPSLLWPLFALVLAAGLARARREAGLPPPVRTELEDLDPDKVLRRRAAAVFATVAVLLAGGLFYRLYYKPQVVDCRALRSAAARGDVAGLRTLLGRGVSPNLADLYGRTALHFAANSGEYDTAKALLEAGADANAASRTTHGTALHYATRRAASRVTQLLLDHGADPNAKCGAAVWLEIGAGDGMTPLHLAAYEGDTASVVALLRHGAQLHETTSYGITALHLAAVSGKAAVVDLLLKWGAKVDVGNRYGYTALHMAAYADHVDVAKALLARGADVRAGIGAWDTPLHLAARRAGVDMVRLLLEHGAPVNARDRYGGTSLHVAALYGKQAAAEALLAAGADVTAQTQKGLTPLAVALKHKHPAVAQLLREHGATN